MIPPKMIIWPNSFRNYGVFVYFIVFLRYHLHRKWLQWILTMHNSHLWRCRIFLSFQKVHSCPFPHTEHCSCFLLLHISFVCSEILLKWHYIIHLSLHPSFFSSSMLYFVLFCCRMVVHCMKLCILKFFLPLLMAT